MVAAYITTIICITILWIAYKSNYTLQYHKRITVEQPQLPAQTVEQPEDQPTQTQLAAVLQDVIYELGGE